MLNNKYRVHEVAKDFKKNSKEITDILTKYATAPKNHMQVLEDRKICSPRRSPVRRRRSPPRRPSWQT